MEVLSRGKTSKGEWVYGDLVHPKSNYVFGNHHRPMDDKFGFILTMNWVHGSRFCSNGVCWVLSETVGQYTNNNDINDVKIFENDIVKGTISSAWAKEEIVCVVKFIKDGFYCISKNGDKYKLMFAKNIEVIGNIIDNPELMEE